MKILLCGGGSAGHISPAIAIAEAIKSKNKDTELLFVGREGGFENSAVVKAGIKLETVKIEGLKRKLTLENFKKIMLTLKATRSASKIINDFSPDAVVATGGYVSWPVLRAAQKMKIPTVIHESNVYPGLVTRLISKKCSLVLLNHKESREYLRQTGNTVVVGNPLRADFSKLSRRDARKEMKLKESDILIVSFGGSGGAGKLNEIITEVMKHTSSHTPGVHHIHATGKKYYTKSLSDELKKHGSGCTLLPYIDDMPQKLRAADIVICRSGAMTLSEIALVGVASILIPSPNVTDNHQYKNAKLLADNNACVLIEEKNLTEELLTGKLELLIKDADARKIMSERVKNFATKDAEKLAAKEITNLISKK